MNKHPFQLAIFFYLNGLFKLAKKSNTDKFNYVLHKGSKILKIN